MKHNYYTRICNKDIHKSGGRPADLVQRLDVDIVAMGLVNSACLASVVSLSFKVLSLLSTFEGSASLEKCLYNGFQVYIHFRYFTLLFFRHLFEHFSPKDFALCHFSQTFQFR